MLHGFDLLRQQYRKYAAAPSGAASSAAQTVKTLASRLSDASLGVDDRRAALLSLKALVRDHADELSEHALVPLVHWIQSGERDNDMLRAAVETCAALCQVPEDDATGTARASANMGRLLQHKDALLTFLQLLQPQHTFYTRFAALQLLVQVVEHRRAEVQGSVLAAPGGCSAVLQCLEASPSSSMEIIRNEALLLLPRLVQDSADIQKIMAFEGGFERLLDIVAQEGRIEGGVVSQDALEGLEALLKDNVSNQNYFRETLSMPLLGPLLFYPPPLPPRAPESAVQQHTSQRNAFLLQEWDEQKLENALLLLRCMRYLVDGQGDGHRANQQVMGQVGLVDMLAQLALASVALPVLKARALHLLAAVLRGSRATQDLFSTLIVAPVAVVTAPAAPAEDGAPSDAPSDAPWELAWQAPQPAMLCLLALAVRGPGGAPDSKVALGVRAAALNALQALVEHNVDVRMTLWHAFVAAPLPEQSHGNTSHLLLDTVAHLPNTSLVPHAHGAAPRFDPYQHLLASMILAALLHNCSTAKEFARRVRLNDEGRCVADATVPSVDDDEPATLIHVVVGNVAMALREHGEAVRRERADRNGDANSSDDWAKVLVGYLALLAMWLWQAPDSIADFCSESANLQVLVQPAAQSTGVDPLLQGLAAFVLGTLYEHSTAPAEVHDGALTRATMHEILHTRIGADQFSTRVGGVKSDPRFAQVTPEVLEDVLTADAPSIWFTWSFVEFWKDHYARIQKSILADPSTSAAADASTSTELQDARQRLAALQEQLTRAQAEAAQLPALRAELDGVREDLELARRDTERAHDAHAAAQRELEAAHASHAASQKEWDAARQVLEHEQQHARAAHDAAQSQLADAHARIAALETEAARPREPSEDVVSLRALEAARQETAAAHAHVAHLEAALSSAEAHARDAEGRAADAEARAADAEARVHAADAQPKSAAPASQPEAPETAELHALQTENEDLLVLLDDITQKRKRDKALLRELGREVSDDDDDDDELA